MPVLRFVVVHIPSSRWDVNLKKTTLQLVTRGFWGFESCCAKLFEKVDSSCCTSLVASSLLFPEEEGSSDSGSDLVPGELWASGRTSKEMIKKDPIVSRKSIYQYLKYKI